MASVPEKPLEAIFIFFMRRICGICGRRARTGGDYMGELDRTRALDDAALDPKNYWPSLIGAALSRGLLSDADMARIQGESAALFVRQAERLTRGESTSLRAARARELTDSIACVLGASLRRCPGADAALETLRREPLDAIFDRGLTIIRRRLGRARAVHERLK